jgi:D-amino-acid dehydrogenase
MELEEARSTVAVIGGGIVGMSAAIALQARGRSVIVIDRGRPRERASYGNAGAIARTSILPLAGPAIWRNFARYALNGDGELSIRRASLPCLSDWLMRFLAHCSEAAMRRAAVALNPLVDAALDQHLAHGDLAGAQTLIRRTGFLKLYRTQAGFAAAALEREILSEAGVEVCIVRGEELSHLEPALTRTYHCGMFSPESASVERPAALVEAYQRAFGERGGAFSACSAQHITHNERGVEVATDRGVVSASHAVIAGGAWSSALTSPLGYKIPLAAQRGYHRRFRVPDAARINRPIIDHRRRLQSCAGGRLGSRDDGRGTGAYRRSCGPFATRRRYPTGANSLAAGRAGPGWRLDGRSCASSSANSGRLTSWRTWLMRPFGVRLS